ncbi:MAG: hypothetical protein IPP77_14470 [Bacteroidetes bacterium]|nr:hypothetical protein [Bacteroidota bacterium]
MENETKSGNKKILPIIIGLLLLINGGAIYLLVKENSKNKDLTEQKQDLQIDFKALSDTLDSKKMELEQFKGKNAELDSIITANQAEIDNQKKQITSLFAKGKMSSKELATAKEMIKQYEVAIADMQKKVEELTQQNQELTTANQQLSTDLHSEKQATAQLNEQNQGLSKKVTLGSLLQLHNMEVVGISKKKSGKEVTEKKVKNVESLRISFETGDNKLLDPGNVSLYLRIINPRGETISIADQGSGTVQSTDGGLIQYTKKADIDWNQSNKKIIVTWSQNITDAGTYKVQVYQSGYKVGDGEVTLK